MLGNANARLNVWQQRRFSDFLTHLGKRTLREGIPTDKHLFPHQFHEKIKSEHDHKASTSKLVCKPKEGRKPWANSQSFRDSATYRRDQQGGGNGLATSLRAPMLSTVRPVEAPDEPLIPIRQLATTSANYLLSTHALTLSDKQTTKRLGTF